MQRGKVIACLAMIFASRIFGLMMILPVISLYANSYLYNSKFLLGVAIGGYGLAQALLQIPLGRLSDRIGRKNTIILGLVLFLAGSLISCYAESIYTLILGRAIQGSGAIGSTILATVSDHTSVENRTKAMACIGITIGASFFLSVLLGPMIAASFGIKGVLYLTALLSLIAFIFAAAVLPHDKPKSPNTRKVKLKSCFGKDLSIMYASILALHLCYTTIFGVVPLVLKNSFALGLGTHGRFYFVSLLFSLLVSVPCIYVVERKNIMRALFICSICALIVSAIGFGYNHSSNSLLYAAMTLFFGAFTFLESLLPSLVSRYAVINSRGMVMGLFSSFQFFGIFMGGMLVGVMQHFFTVNETFYMVAAVLMLWLILCYKLRAPSFTLWHYKGEQNDAVLMEVASVQGVGESTVTDGKIILKVDEKICDTEVLNKILLDYNYKRIEIN